jgi:hypothetical protein
MWLSVKYGKLALNFSLYCFGMILSFLCSSYFEVLQLPTIHSFTNISFKEKKNLFFSGTPKSAKEFAFSFVND